MRHAGVDSESGVDRRVRDRTDMLAMRTGCQQQRIETVVVAFDTNRCTVNAQSRATHDFTTRETAHIAAQPNAWRREQRRGAAREQRRAEKNSHHLKPGLSVIVRPRVSTCASSETARAFRT